MLLPLVLVTGAFLGLMLASLNATAGAQTVPLRTSVGVAPGITSFLPQTAVAGAGTPGVIIGDNFLDTSVVQLVGVVGVNDLTLNSSINNGTILATINAETVTHTGVYTLMVTNTPGGADGKSFTITAGPPYVLVANAPDGAIAGVTATLQFTGTDGYGNPVEWDRHHADDQ